MPNILFILSDDQGPWAAGCYGNDEIRTPNIDRLAETGVRFENFFVATPVCSPSRATFMTGRISSQHGVHDWIREGNVGDNAAAYLKDEICYTDMLANNGWKCGISGKWHLGNSQIAQHGFSHWYVHQTGGGPYNNAPMIRNGELIDEPGYVTNAITEDALQFINTHAKGEQPFYLSVHYTAPHSPWTGHPQDIVDSYNDCPFKSCPQETRHPWALGLTDHCLGNREMLKGYFAAVTAMDNDIGRIIDRIEELGIREDTLIFFFSDNGFNCGHHGLWGKGNGTEPRNMYENSIKVPAIASHIGRIPQGHAQKAMVCAYDFMPTLLDYLGLPLPERNLPGKSFLPALLGNDDTCRDDVIIYDEYGRTRMIRTRDWKYICRYGDAPDELYDIANDPDERTNLADDASRKGKVRELKNRMEEWFAEYVNPDKDGMKYDVTGLGQMRPVGKAWDNDNEPFFHNA